jgi:hypothetical protein
MLVNKSSKKLHVDIKINYNNSTIKGENFMNIGLGMTSWEFYENKWFYMKYIGKYLSEEILLTRECIYVCEWLVCELLENTHRLTI